MGFSSEYNFAFVRAGLLEAKACCQDLRAFTVSAARLMDVSESSDA